MAKHTSIEVLRDIMLGGTLYADINRNNPDPYSTAVPGIRYNATDKIWEYNTVSSSTLSDANWTPISNQIVISATLPPSGESILDEYPVNTLFVTTDGQIGILNAETGNIIKLTQNIIDDITDITEENKKSLPTVNVLTGYVNNFPHLNLLEGNISDNINIEENAVSPKQVVDYVTDYVKSISGECTPEIYYHPDISSSNAEQYKNVAGLHIFQNKQTYISNGTTIDPISYPVTSGKLENAKDNGIVVPTCQSVYQFVDERLSGVQSDKPEVFYVSEFPTITDGITSGIYIDQNNQTRFWTGSDWEYLSYEIVDEIKPGTVSSNIAATTKAISAFVDEKLNSFQSDKPEVFYVSEFPAKTSDLTSGLYIDSNGQTRFLNDVHQWEELSYAVVDNIIPDSVSSGKIASTKAISAFVDEKLSEVQSNTPEVFYINRFDIYTEDNQPETSGIYIDQNSQTRFWTGSDWEYLSYEIADEIKPGTVSSNFVASTKAISAFVDDKINGFQYVYHTGRKEILDSISLTDKRLTKNVFYVDNTGDDENGISSGQVFATNEEGIAQSVSYGIIKVDSLSTFMGLQDKDISGCVVDASSLQRILSELSGLINK